MESEIEQWKKECPKNVAKQQVSIELEVKKIGTENRKSEENNKSKHKTESQHTIRGKQE